VFKDIGKIKEKILLINNYNGDLFIKVFENPYIKTTLGNDRISSFPVDVMNFKIIKK